ncbi:hypothetical protein FPZ24_15440 [Sphingomonas panacisoli]|uniref:Terminase n=1 Tax=Sphingomonas panacisoli TaxID=1813879 RepID=A0A5B8LKB2_9SPHN|nr:hypothetical protein [Sphingomonas panacisoli]QDZ08688.1 hypothetical protein FPZ24_15440 [Sphingomonas panacisoli]
MSVLGGTNGCAAQLRARRPDSWTRKKRTIFLDHLEASCNIRASAWAAGMSDGAARGLRRRDPEFAAAWDEALEIGTERLRAELLSRALERRGDGETPTTAERDGIDPVPMDDAMRIRVLQACRASAEGRNGQTRVRPMRDAEDVFASIAHKLDRLEKKLRADGKA